ncbi:hypothetical protein OCH80_08570 [Lactobacillus sp. 23-2]|uniref:hypothetical protein n=1 Tax=Lactobacillus sp. 23-2 TaxID=2981842 RepID=UPI0038389039
MSGSVFVAVMLFFSILGYRARTALHLSRERSQAELTANNPAGLVVYEAKASDANILFVNHAMVKLVDNPHYGLIAYQSFIKDRQTEK